MKNGYIDSGTDATNARATLSGRAYMANKHTTDPAQTSSTPVPAGTKVYMQFYDVDGAVSPTYVTQTYNNLANSGQVGPGFYAFDFRGAYGDGNEKRAGMWVDANGKEHQFRASTGQHYRLWIEDFETEDGNTATMFRQVNGFFPGSFARTPTTNNIGGFPLAGTNMQRAALFMTTKPKGEYMTRPRNEWKQDNEGPVSNPGATLRLDDYLAGRVWLENGSGTIAAGPGYGSEDTPAAGYRVVASSLTKEGVAAYKADVESIDDHGKRAAAAKKLLTENPHYISQTVTAPVNDQGYYTVRFDKGNLNRNYVYAYVEDPDGNRQIGYSAYNSPEFRAPNDVNNALLSQAAPQGRPVRNAFNNVHFGLITTPNSELDITNFDMVANPATRGDVAKVRLSGNNLSPLNNKIVWTNSKGDTVHECPVANLASDCDYTIPADAKDGEVYRATLFSGATPVAADSLIVRVPEDSDKDATKNQPVYEDTTTKQGTAATVEAPKNEDGSPLPSGTTFAPGNNVPEGVTVNPDGTISIGESIGVGKYDVPVVVTYPDQSRETVFAKVSVEEPEEAPADNLGYPEDGIKITEQDSGDERTKKSGEPTLPGSIVKEDGDKFRFGDDLPGGFVQDAENPNRIIKDGTGGETTPDDESDDVVVTIDPNTGDVTVVAGDKGNTNGPQEIPVEYVGENDTVKGKDSVSVDVKPRVDSPDEGGSPAQDLGYPGGGVSIGPDDSGDERTKKSGEPTLPGSIVKEDGDKFRFPKELSDGFARVNDDETRVKFDGGTPDDESDDVDLTIDPETGNVTVKGSEKANTGGRREVPVELVSNDGDTKVSGTVGVEVTPQSEQTPPEDGSEDVAEGLGYPGNIFVGPDNYERVDSTGIPKLPESLKQGGNFSFGDDLPEGFVPNENPSWHGVEEIIREGNDPSEKIVLRINKENGKVEVQAGDNADYPLTNLPVKYIDPDGKETSDEVTVLIRPVAHSWNGEPTESDNGSVNVPYTGSKPDQTGDLTPSVTKGDGEATLDENGNIIYNPGKDDQPGAQIEVTVSDSNGNPIRVVEFTLPSNDASEYEPVGKTIIVVQGGEPDAAEGIANKGELPEGTEFEFDGPVDTATPGEKPATVIVSYPDGSTEPVDVTINVAAAEQDLLPDADRYNPVAKDGVTTSEGEPVDAGALIDNKDDLPAGTTFEWEIEPNVDVPGKPFGVVKVNYPDGSSETVGVQLEVSEVDTQADKHDPKGQPITVAEGETPDAAAGIANRDELPEGTEFEFDGPVDTSTPGEKSAKVIVAYPDGSTEAVDVTVSVSEVDTQADEFEPRGKTVIVGQGGEPDAAEGIANRDELPEGTEFEFDGPVDTSTPGEQTAKVIVAYPDGSTEAVDVTINVAAAEQDLLPDTERYEPEWNDTIIDDSSQTTVENKGDELPHGTEVELGWSHGGLNQGKEDWDVDLEENGDITITPGSDAQPGDAIVIEVELNYPDGTSETKTIVVQVRGDREEFVPGNFGEIPPLTGDDNDDLTAGYVFTEAPTVNPVHPGDNIITGTGKPGATITVTGPNGFSTTTTVHENGNWSVDLTGGATPEAQYIVSQKDGDKNESDQVLVKVGKENVILPTPGAPGSSELPGSSLGSSNFNIPKHLQCAIFAGGVTAIPLILLSPLHNMYEMMINPHLNGLREQFHRELHALDQQVRRGLGVEGHPALQLMDHINGRVNEFNQQLGQFAHDNRHIGLAAAAIAVAGLSFQHCMNTQATPASSASLVGSSSSSQEQAPARNEAQEDNAGGIVGWFQGLFNRN